MAELNPPPSIAIAHSSGMIASCLLEREGEEPTVPFILNDLSQVLDIRLTVDQAEELALGLKAIVDHARAYAETQTEEG